MNGIDFFVDTNILIYIMTGHPHPEIPYIAKFAHGISAISEIELLGKKVLRHMRQASPEVY